MSKILLFLFIPSTIIYSQISQYSPLLESSYNKVNYDSMIFHGHAESVGVKGFDNEDSKIYNILPNSFKECISYKINEIDPIMGLYFVNHLNKGFSPFTDVFSEWSGSPTLVNIDINPSFAHNNFKTRGQQISKLLSMLKCSVIDLYDARVAISDLEYLAKIDSLQILALPARGMQFNQTFNFPSQIKVLIIRNALLSEHFFEALVKLNSLEKLVIEDCFTNLDYPRPVEWSYLKEVSWQKLPMVFSGGMPNLKSISIKNSDPNIFNYIIPENWSSLAELEVDIFNGNSDAISMIMTSNKSLRESFPVLKTFNISATNHLFPLINENSNRVSDGLLKINLSQYNE